MIHGHEIFGEVAQGSEGTVTEGDFLFHFCFFRGGGGCDGGPGVRD